MAAASLRPSLAAARRWRFPRRLAGPVGARLRKGLTWLSVADHGRAVGRAGRRGAGDDTGRAAAARPGATGRQPVAARLHRPGRAGADGRQPRQPALDHRPRPGGEGPARRAVSPDRVAVHDRGRRSAAWHGPPAGAGDGVGRLPRRAPRRGAGHRHPDHHRPPRRHGPARPVRLGDPGGVELLPRSAGTGPRHDVGDRGAAGRGEGEGDPRHPGRPHRDRAAAGGVDQGHRRSTVRRGIRRGRSPTSTGSAPRPSRVRARASASRTAPAPSPRSTSTPRRRVVWALVTDLDHADALLRRVHRRRVGRRPARRRSRVPRTQPAPGDRRVDDPVLRRHLRRAERLRLAHLRSRPAQAPAGGSTSNRPAAGTRLRFSYAMGPGPSGHHDGHRQPTPARRHGCCAAASTRCRPTCSAPSKASRQLAEQPR